MKLCLTICALGFAWLLVGIGQRLKRVENLLRAELAQEKTVILEIQEMIDQAKANTDAEQAAIGVIVGIATRIDAAVQAALAANALSPDDVKSITDETAALKSSAAALGAAIVADTPAAPTV